MWVYETQDWTRELEKVSAVCFETCSKTPDKTALLAYIRGALATLAMTNYPFKWGLITPLPGHPVKEGCEYLKRAVIDTTGYDVSNSREEIRKWAGDSILKEQNKNVFEEGTKCAKGSALYLLNKVVSLYVGNSTCKDTGKELIRGMMMKGVDEDVEKNQSPQPTASSSGGGMEMFAWNYQACTQIPFQPLTSDYLGFYPPRNNQMRSLEKACKEEFGSDVVMRPDYLPTTYGTGEQMVAALSNTIIVDGEYDPWRTGALGGYERDYSNSTFLPHKWLSQERQVLKIFPVKGSAHHQDLIAEHEEDHPELREARKIILETLSKWNRGKDIIEGHSEDSIPIGHSGILQNGSAEDEGEPVIVYV